VDSKFKIAVDGGEAQTVTLTLASCDSGANIAAEMQTKIQALGGAFAAVTVGFANDKYTITSGTKGQGSAITITRAEDHNVTEELKLGPDGGTSTAGTGVGANSATATAQEVADFINANATNFTAEAADGKVTVSGKVTGGTLIIGADVASTANAVLGLTAGTYFGKTGLGYTAMANNTYYVQISPVGIAKADKANACLAWANDKSTTGFEIVAATDGAAFEVDVLVVGLAAA
jgi:hypothetical protein